MSENRDFLRKAKREDGFWKPSAEVALASGILLLVRRLGGWLGGSSMYPGQKNHPHFGEKVVLSDRAYSFGRDTHGPMGTPTQPARSAKSTLAISYHSQIVLTPTVAFWKGKAL